MRRRILISVLAGVCFVGNVVLANAAEANLWKERQQALAVEQASAAPAPVSRLSALIPPVAARLPAVSAPRNIPPALLDAVRALPASSGAISKITLPRSGIPSRVVVCLQDVHLNPEAQRHIGDAVAALAAKGAGLVALEGLFAPLDAAPVRRFPHHDLVARAADYLLRTNEISGAVHAAFTATGAFPSVVGVDDAALYAKNVSAYLESRARAATARAAVDGERRRLAGAKARTFNRDLAALDAAVESYRGGRSSLGAYARMLASHARTPPASVARFLRALSLEESLDFGAVERQRAALLESLVPTLTPADADGLLQDAVAYRTGQMSHTAFYTSLTDLCRAHRVDLSRYPAMDRYVRYVVLSDGLDGDVLLSDLTMLEERAYAAAARTEAERRLCRQSRRLALVAKLVDFSLSPAEWNEYERGTPDFDVISRAALAPFEAFYAAAEARNRAMAVHLLRAMDAAHVSNAVLVAGGYHGAGLAKELADRGVATIAVTPRLTAADAEHGSAYLAAFTQEKAPLEKLFAGQRLFVSPNPARGARLIPVIVLALLSMVAAVSAPLVTYRQIEPAAAVSAVDIRPVNETERIVDVEAGAGEVAVDVVADSQRDVLSVKQSLANEKSRRSSRALLLGALATVLAVFASLRGALHREWGRLTGAAPQTIEDIDPRLWRNEGRFIDGRFVVYPRRDPLKEIRRALKDSDLDAFVRTVRTAARSELDLYLWRCAIDRLVHENPAFVDRYNTLCARLETERPDEYERLHPIPSPMSGDPVLLGGVYVDFPGGGSLPPMFVTTHIWGTVSPAGDDPDDAPLSARVRAVRKILIEDRASVLLASVSDVAGRNVSLDEIKRIDAARIQAGKIQDVFSIGVVLTNGTIIPFCLLVARGSGEKTRIVDVEFDGLHRLRGRPRVTQVIANRTVMVGDETLSGYTTQFLNRRGEIIYIDGHWWNIGWIGQTMNRDGRRAAMYANTNHPHATGLFDPADEAAITAEVLAPFVEYSDPEDVKGGWMIDRYRVTAGDVNGRDDYLPPTDEHGRLPEGGVPGEAIDPVLIAWRGEVRATPARLVQHLFSLRPLFLSSEHVNADDIAPFVVPGVLEALALGLERRYGAAEGKQRLRAWVRAYFEAVDRGEIVEPKMSVGDRTEPIFPRTVVENFVAVRAAPAAEAAERDRLAAALPRPAQAQLDADRAGVWLAYAAQGRRAELETAIRTFLKRPYVAPHVLDRDNTVAQLAAEAERVVAARPGTPAVPDLPALTGAGAVPLAQALRSALDDMQFDWANESLRRAAPGDYETSPHPITRKNLLDRLRALAVQRARGGGSAADDGFSFTDRHRLALDFLMFGETLSREELATVLGAAGPRIDDFVRAGLFAATADGRFRMNGLSLVSRRLPNGEPIYLLADTPQHFPGYTPPLRVYVAEDSYILMERLVSLTGVKGVIAETGSGSGIQLISMLKTFAGVRKAVGVEIDARARQVSTFNAMLNGVADRMRVVANPEELGRELNGDRIDLAFSNPPFIPLPEFVPVDRSVANRLRDRVPIEEDGSGTARVNLRALWARAGWGGVDGLTVTREFLNFLAPHMADRSRIVIYSTFAGNENGPGPVQALSHGRPGWTVTTVPLTSPTFPRSWRIRGWPGERLKNAGFLKVISIMSQNPPLRESPYKELLLSHVAPGIDAAYAAAGVTHFYEGFAEIDINRPTATQRSTYRAAFERGHVSSPDPDEMTPEERRWVQLWFAPWYEFEASLDLASFTAGHDPLSADQQRTFVAGLSGILRWTWFSAFGLLLASAIWASLDPGVFSIASASLASLSALSLTGLSRARAAAVKKDKSIPNWLRAVLVLGYVHAPINIVRHFIHNRRHPEAAATMRRSADALTDDDVERLADTLARLREEHFAGRKPSGGEIADVLSRRTRLGVEGILGGRRDLRNLSAIDLDRLAQTLASRLRVRNDGRTMSELEAKELLIGAGLFGTPRPLKAVPVAGAVLPLEGGASLAAGDRDEKRLRALLAQTPDAAPVYVLANPGDDAAALARLAAVDPRVQIERASEGEPLIVRRAGSEVLRLPDLDKRLEALAARIGRQNAARLCVAIAPGVVVDPAGIGPRDGRLVNSVRYLLLNALLDAAVEVRRADLDTLATLARVISRQA